MLGKVQNEYHYFCNISTVKDDRLFTILLMVSVNAASKSTSCTPGYLRIITPYPTPKMPCLRRAPLLLQA